MLAKRSASVVTLPILVLVAACSSSSPSPEGEAPPPSDATAGDGGSSGSSGSSGTTPADGACRQDGDCATDFCGAAGTCEAPPASAHADGRRNAGETDVDCGGASAVTCKEGQKCKVAADCEGACTAGICGPPGDTDGKKNLEETDVDCGGPTAKKCAVGKACSADSDCGLRFCQSNKCATPSATDGIRNGTESDVDCGGDELTFDGIKVAAAPRCAAASACGKDADCEASVCADTKRCVEAPSCRPIHGGSTCGTGEYGAAGAMHESCCKSLPVPGMTMMQDGASKQVYLDKYEITAGRIRQWVTAIKAENGGVPNIQGWIKTRMATDPILAAMYPSDQADYLPEKGSGQGQEKVFPYKGGGTVTLDMGLEDQIGPTSYYRDVQVNGTSGCGMYTGSYGHRTYWFDTAWSTYFGEINRAAAYKDVLDEKSMNCLAPIMFAAFCAWDGGYLAFTDAIWAAWGTKAWPWGATPSVTDNTAKIANFNAGTGNFGATNDPRYLFPVVNYGTFADDFTPIIAAPGRFPGDIASEVRPAMESWMDLGGNMIEFSWKSGTWRGWTGSSFEGHNYGKAGNSTPYFLDKYGKGGARCMRLR